MGLDDDDAGGKSSGCGLGNLFRRRGSNSLRSSSAPAITTVDAVPPKPKAAAGSHPLYNNHRQQQSNHLHHQHRQHRQSNHPSNNNGGASSPALVRASSGNVMLYGSLGNLRAPGAATPNRNDVLDFLPMTADEIKLQTTSKNNDSPKPRHKPKPRQREAVLCRALSVREDPEELKKKGNDEYMAGNYVDAVDYYERAIAVDPSKPAYWSNKAAALMAQGRILDAIADCREALRVDPSFGRAHHRLGTLYLRTGHGDRAAKQYKLAAHDASPEDMSRAHAVQALVAKCDDSRRRGSWKGLLRDVQAAVSAGADASPKLACYQAEAFLSLQRPEEADAVLGKNGVCTEEETDRHVEIFGAGSCGLVLATRALVDTAMGRLEAAVAASDEAVRVSPGSREATGAARQAKAVASARNRGNALFKAGKLREACVAYEDGLREHPGNATLLCNRAACRCKLGEWEAALRDCDAALGARPSYGKARLRRAACNDRLGRWEASVLDYDALLRETPGDEDVAAALAHARTQLGGVTQRRAAA
ncbi:hypothetical protein QYE76_065366 [Lolium multiflorum]|uniref:Inactive TPR repeat-containing thioredoxin TTL3 n=1 Tax=Lolium multiflorum TaxID=4521 RepID=A0AAD8S9Z5_LOLMU|nr:hypothetical protein QYE76_065366 [Lolium multiflorum]